MEYAGIDKNKLVLVDDLNNLLNLVEEKSTGDIYTMVCFDMTAIIKKMIEEQEKWLKYCIYTTILWICMENQLM